MFYVSFLIKEGRAKIFVAEDGLPQICPIAKSNTQEEPTEPKQVTRESKVTACTSPSQLNQTDDVTWDKTTFQQILF